MAPQNANHGAFVKKNEDTHEVGDSVSLQDAQVFRCKPPLNVGAWAAIHEVSVLRLLN